MIEIKNVSKTYNGKKKVLKNVSFKIESGEIFAEYRRVFRAHLCDKTGSSQN